MKRESVKKNIFVIGIIILLAFTLTACQSNKSSGNADNENTPAVKNDENNNDVQKSEIELEFTEEGIIKSEIAEKIIKEKADKLIHAIGSKDTQLISEDTHPEKGVRFTPYTYVSPEKDLVFDKEQIKSFFTDQEIYLWGNYDGTGDEIKLTPSEYYNKFIYTEDFINAEKIGYNEVLSHGNMLENQFEVYEHPIIVEYYFSGFNPDYEGMDWRSLRLVFEEYDNNWYLVGIINNQWTI